MSPVKCYQSTNACQMPEVSCINLISWSEGRALLWDLKFCDTFAKSNVDKFSKETGKAAAVTTWEKFRFKEIRR